MTSPLNLAFLKISRRAEQQDLLKLVETFVDVGPLFALLASTDHQIVYGRRGTGKTHALSYLADEVRKKGDLAVYVDMRTIGSTGGIYADPDIPIPERGTRLLLDTLGVIHGELVTTALELAYAGHAGPALTLLDRLADEIVDSVRVVGPVEVQERDATTRAATTATSAELTVSGKPQLSLGRQDSATTQKQDERSTRRTGTERHRVHFGAIAKLLADIVAALPMPRLWILLDEWSSVPVDLQPLLADLIRRSMLPVPNVTVKIGAIEQRSEFWIPLPGGDHLGIEVGADAAAALDLDDFMVFGNDAERAKDFFSRLLYKHVAATLAAEDMPDQVPANPGQLVQRAFTQTNTFDEFVRAAEGVPRDAINILALAAAKADDGAISIPHIRTAARSWYQRDKESAVAARPDAHDLLVWIIAEVLGERQAKAFMLPQGEDRQHPLIRALYDARVLHLIRRGIAARDQPGVRYNGWGLDYGCYVDLITTVKAPKGMFPAEDADGQAAFVDVPVDDYRSIRRAILDLSRFENRKNA